MSTKSKAYLVGGGIGSLAAAAFMIRDGSVPGGNISILEAAPIMGGSLDGAGDPEGGYSLRGGRMLTTDNYECTWDQTRRREVFSGRTFCRLHPLISLFTYTEIPYFNGSDYYAESCIT